MVKHTSDDWIGWSGESRAFLREKWADGWTTKRIGDELGCGKNAVVSQRKILNLPTRGTPIKRSTEDRQKKMSAIADHVRRLATMGHSKTNIRVALRIEYRMVCEILGPDYLAVRRPKERKVLLDDPYRIAAQEVRAERVIEKKAARVAPVSAPVVPNRTMSKQCCWLDGERGSFRQCQAIPMSGPEGRVWCAEHRERVFTRIGKEAA